MGRGEVWNTPLGSKVVGTSDVLLSVPHTPKFNDVWALPASPNRLAPRSPKNVPHTPVLHQAQPITPGGTPVPCTPGGSLFNSVQHQPVTPGGSVQQPGSPLHQPLTPGGSRVSGPDSKIAMQPMTPGGTRFRLPPQLLMQPQMPLPQAQPFTPMPQAQPFTPVPNQPFTPVASTSQPFTPLPGAQPVTPVPVKPFTAPSTPLPGQPCTPAISSSMLFVAPEGDKFAVIGGETAPTTPAISAPVHRKNEIIPDMPLQMPVTPGGTSSFAVPGGEAIPSTPVPFCSGTKRKAPEMTKNAEETLTVPLFSVQLTNGSDSADRSREAK